MTKTLYEFYQDCGHMGSVEGRFFATPEEIEACLGKTAYFGDILGKHSDVAVGLRAENFKVLTDDSTFIALAEKLNIDLNSGYNPLEYLEGE